MFEVFIDTYHKENTKVKVDGKELTDVVSIDLHLDGENLPTLTMKLLPEKIKITGDPIIKNKE